MCCWCACREGTLQTVHAGSISIRCIVWPEIFCARQTNYTSIEIYTAQLRHAIAGCRAVGGHAAPQPAGLVLGIESSCDDTGVAVMTPEGHILGQVCVVRAPKHI